MLRRVEPDDIAVFFEQQADPAAAAMAAFPTRDRVAHDAHWARILDDSSCVARAIVLPDGQVVGNIGSFDVEGERHVGYWIGREHWGQGHATRALTEFVAEFPERPLYARVVEHNAASPVSEDYGPNAQFSGHIIRVDFDLKPDFHPDHDDHEDRHQANFAHATIRQ